MSLRRASIAALALATLSGCAVSYGKIPHGNFVAADRCNPAPGAVVPSADALPLFVATSRLPDCRTTAITLLRHRSDTVRLGRFAGPKPGEKFSTKAPPPLAIMADADWWAALADRAGQRGRALVYVHGFRESFATNANDTAQIARLTGFDGPVIAYVWPSQSSTGSYAVDETNISWSEPDFASFLARLAKQAWVKDVVVVAHSLGARMAVHAIEQVDRTIAAGDSSNISTIILASPDIDRAIFERTAVTGLLASERVQAGRRVHVYVSAADRAMALSRQVHGYPRLGSPFCFNPFEAADLEAHGVPVRCYPPPMPGLAIIDTTAASQGSSGHSNYLRSAPVCADFAVVVGGVVWMTTGPCQEGEVAVRLCLASDCAWDTGMWVHPDHRMGRAFAALLAGMGEWLDAEGRAWSASCIADYNLASLIAHRRLGMVTLGSIAVLSTGPVQWAWLAGRGMARASARRPVDYILPSPTR